MRLARLTSIGLALGIAIAAGGCRRRVLLARPDPPPPPKVTFAWELERDANPMARPKPRPKVASPPIAPAIEAKLAPLRKFPVYGGVYEGRWSKPSRFYEIGKVVLAEATPADLAAMVVDPDAVVRAMALWGYAKRGETAPLRESVCDDAKIPEMTGCFGPATISLGTIACNLLDHPDRLDPVDHADHRPPPRLSTDAANVALSVRMGAADDCLGGSPSSLQASFDYRRITFLGLRMQAPKVPAWKLVRAAARGGDEKSGPLMVAILEDATLPTDARLTAATALVRARPGTDESYVTVIREQEAFLDGAVPGLASRLERALAIHERGLALLSGRLGTLDAPKIQRITDQALALFDEPHPVLIPILLRDDLVVARAKELRPARGRALRALVEGPFAHEGCWDVFRSAPYELRRALDGADRASIAATMTPTELAAFEAAVDALIAKLGADARCL